MHRILFISKNDREITPLQSALVREGYRVAMSLPDEDSVMVSVGNLTPEVVVVDSRHADCSSNECRLLLSKECNLKEIFIIALLNKEQSMNMDWTGIDEFLLEPFDGDELISRLHLLLWKTKKINGDQEIKAGSLIMDLKNYNVSLDGVPIELTFKEYELLRFLATHRGRVFTREALLDHVWGYDYYGGTRTVDVHVRRLRAKLSPSCDSFIETIRNVGYKFSS